MKALDTIVLLVTTSALVVAASLTLDAQQPGRGHQRTSGGHSFSVPDGEIAVPVRNASRPCDVVVTNTGKVDEKGKPIPSESDPWVLVFVRDAEGLVVAGPIVVRLGDSVSVGVPKGGSVEVHDEDPGTGDDDGATLSFELH